MPNYEESTSFLGTWGPYQERIIFLLCLICVPVGFHLQSVKLLLAIPQNQCKIPGHGNLSQDCNPKYGAPPQIKPHLAEVLRRMPFQTRPSMEVGGETEKDRLDQVKKPSALGIKPSSIASLSSLKEEGPKDRWTCSNEFYESAVVTEFHLVCSDQWNPTMISLVYFLGELCGCWIFGPISDQFGRKPVLFGAIFIFLISSLVLVFCTSWEMFIVLFFMLGMAQITSYTALFALGIEMLVDYTRILYSGLCLPFSELLGRVLLHSTASLIKDWKYLQLRIAFFSVASLSFYWSISESPRWLALRGRVTEAEDVIRSAARENEVEAPPVIFHSENAENATRQAAETFSFLDLLKNARTRGITVVLWFMWFSVNFSYDQMSLSMPTLSANPTANYILGAVVELLGYIISWVGLCCFPRQLLVTSIFLLGTLDAFLIPVVQNSHPTFTLLLLLLGKVCFTAGRGVLYTYTGELAPTAIRHTLMSSCIIFSRVGSFFSLYLSEQFCIIGH